MSEKNPGCEIRQTDLQIHGIYPGHCAETMNQRCFLFPPLWRFSSRSAAPNLIFFLSLINSDFRDGCKAETCRISVFACPCLQNQGNAKRPESEHEIRFSKCSGSDCLSLSCSKETGKRSNRPFPAFAKFIFGDRAGQNLSLNDDYSTFGRKMEDKK